MNIENLAWDDWYFGDKPSPSKIYWYPTAFSNWGIEEHLAIERVIKSNRFTMGEEVKRFEEALATYHGRRYAIMVNSGSSANLLMVAALFELGRLRRGDAVAVPALAWSTTYAPLVQYGLELELLDCDDTWNVSTIAHDEEFKLIVKCSILGSPCLPSGIKYYNTIEDNCESLGASLGGELCGTMGVMSSCSFFYSHQISAVEGGAILTDSQECDRILRMLRSHGWTRDVEKPESFEEEYNFQCFGYNVRPVEMHAAVAYEQLKKLPQMIEARQRNWDHFRDLTYNLPIKLQASYPGAKRSSFGIAFTVLDSSVRTKLVEALRAESIDCRLPTGGSFRRHHYGKPWDTQLTPNADHVHSTGMFIGNAPWAIDAQIERAVHVMKWVL